MGLATYFLQFRDSNICTGLTMCGGPQQALHLQLTDKQPHSMKDILGEVLGVKEMQLQPPDTAHAALDPSKHVQPLLLVLS